MVKPVYAPLNHSRATESNQAGNNIT